MKGCAPTSRAAIADISGCIMDILTQIALWVLGSVLVGIAAGFFLGRGRSRGPENEIAERERQAMLRTMVGLLNSADQLNTDVAAHNSEIQENARHVKDLRVTGEMAAVRQTLLGHMTFLLKCNQDLQQDLLCTRYRLEEQAQEIDHARREARTDELTGANNRKAFNEKLHLLLDEQRRRGTTFVLMLIDLDQFKRINDAHGHPVGDRVLKTVGGWLKQGVREGDFVGRFGGDEFAVLLPKTELPAGRDLAESLRTSTAERASTVAARREQIAVSLSIGVVMSRNDDTAESILQRADEAMYRAKRNGRNQVQCEPTAEAEDAAVGNAAPAASLQLPALAETSALD
jgi:diguanylate cyclase